MLRRKTRSRSDSDAKRGVLVSIRQLLRTRRPFQRLAVRVDGAPRAATAITEPTVHSSGAALLATMPPTAHVPAPPRDLSASDDDDSYPGEGVGTSEDAARSQSETSRAKGKKAKQKASSGWVAKLLNQAAPHRDRVHARGRRKPHIVEPPERCHVMLRVPKDPYLALLARVFDFLAPLAPIRTCVAINKAFAESVGKYYSTFCSWPRPQPYLLHELLQPHNEGLLGRVLTLLPMAERVRAGTTCRSFRRIADSLPLELTGPASASQFLRRLSPSRIEARFTETAVLDCDSIVPADAIRLLCLMSDDDGDHFRALQEISLTRLPLFDSEAQFVELVQSLFSDRFSKTLRSLVLSDLGLRDEHFQHLARLFYDGHFPQLQAVNLSKNLFSSRFMRDWARSFHEERFCGLQTLDVSAVGMGVEDMSRFFESLRFVPALRVLRFSQNFCSVEGLHILARLFKQRHLMHLDELSCSAIAASDHAIAVLLEALGSAGTAPKLRVLDFSGNDLSGGDQSMQWLSSALSSKAWPQLRYLNLSFSKPSSAGVQLLASGLAKCPSLELREVLFAGNQLAGEAFEALIRAVEAKQLCKLELLNLTATSLGPVEFEALANCLSNGTCPRLQSLLLSGNYGNADCMIRFRRFLKAPAASKLYKLDLSANLTNYWQGNAFPPHSLAFLANELSSGSFHQLKMLNVARNRELPSVLRFQQLIRSGKCPSLACLQVGYAQSELQGYAFVRTVRSKMSVEELRLLKQLKFEASMKRIEDENLAKAARAAARCNRQTKLLREMYDHMENQADHALRRRKRLRKSPHLHIHEEIQRLKQEKYHDNVCRNLDSALLSSNKIAHTKTYQ